MGEPVRGTSPAGGSGPDGEAPGVGVDPQPAEQTGPLTADKVAPLIAKRIAGARRG